MTQCATLMRNATWINPRVSGAATLQAAWKTLAGHVMTVKSFICTFSIRRTDAQEKSAGLLSLTPYLKQKNEDECLVLVKRPLSREQKFGELHSPSIQWQEQMDRRKFTSNLYNMCILYKRDVVHVFNDSNTSYLRGLSPPLLTVASIDELF